MKKKPCHHLNSLFAADNSTSSPAGIGVDFQARGLVSDTDQLLLFGGHLQEARSGLNLCFAFRVLLEINLPYGSTFTALPTTPANGYKAKWWYTAKQNKLYRSSGLFTKGLQNREIL